MSMIRSNQRVILDRIKSLFTVPDRSGLVVSLLVTIMCRVQFNSWSYRVWSRNFFFPFHIDNRCLINIQKKNAPTVKRKNNVENDILFFRICKINAHLWFQRLNRKYNFLLFLVISKNNNRATNFYRNCSSRLDIYYSRVIFYLFLFRIKYNKIMSFHFSYINTLRIYLRISFLLFLVHEMDKMINGRSQFIPRILLSRYFFE